MVINSSLSNPEKNINLKMYHIFNKRNFGENLILKLWKLELTSVLRNWFINEIDGLIDCILIRNVGLPSMYFFWMNWAFIEEKTSDWLLRKMSVSSESFVFHDVSQTYKGKRKWVTLLCFAVVVTKIKETFQVFARLGEHFYSITVAFVNRSVLLAIFCYSWQWTQCLDNIVWIIE